MKGFIFRLADEVIDEHLLNDVPDLFVIEFTNKILEQCMVAIEARYNSGDLSERAQGLRNAKAAIRKHFEAEI